MKTIIITATLLIPLWLQSWCYAMGGIGASCNPTTASWSTCTKSLPSWEASVSTVIQIPGGNYATPYRATTAYRKYVLQGNMTADGTAIEVVADYTTIDLNGYTITYNQVSPGEGVASGAYNLDHVSIRNGSIIQGAAMSEGDEYGRGSNPVGTYSTIAVTNMGIQYLHIANLYVRYGGRDVGGIVCSGNYGLYEQNTIEDTYEFGTLKNRHQGVEALTGSKNASATGNIYRNNTVLNTRQRGIVTGNDSEVYGNNITIRSIATNASGVGQFAGKNIKIYSNTITGRGEHPVGIMAGGGTGSKNYEAYDNLINLQTTALGEEYGSAYLADPSATYISNSAAGIRVTWGGDNLDMYNNQITIVTDDRYTGTYSPTGDVAYINGGGKGLFIGAYAGESSKYRDNVISVTGDATYTYGVTCSYSFSDGMFVTGNTITSSQYNIVIGDDYGACNGYPLFQNNTLIKAVSAQAGYRTYSNTYNDTDRNAQVRLVDNTYQGGAAETSIYLQPEDAGLTDVYFGTYNNGFMYSKQLHDNGGLSSTLIETIHDPTITLAYRNPVVAQGGRRYRVRLAEPQ